VIFNVHSDQDCIGEFCGIHHPSDHHMTEWNQLFTISGLFRICAHDIGHPDPDSPYRQQIHVNRGEQFVDCDGCCVPPLAPILDALRQMSQELA
jgi:hypothetical protein